ncbi:MAG: FtsX-like permease family protein [Acidimicrobiales bacterium]
MSAVLLRAWSDLRRRWRAWATLGVLVGLIAGTVIAAAAGARRTDTAFGRFLAATKAPDVFAFTDQSDPAFAQIPYDEVVRFPEVAAAARASALTVLEPSDTTLVVSEDPRLGTALLRHKMLAGRPPRPDRADEVMVSFTLAKAHHLKVGSGLRLSLAAGQQPPVPLSFSVVGIEASADEFPPQTGTGVNQAWASPAFAAAGRASGVYDAAFAVIVLRLRHGRADVPGVERRIQEMAAGKPANVFALADQTVNTQHSIHLQAVALWLLAALLALAGVLVVAQLLLRQGQMESGDHPHLRALGMSKGQLWALGMVPAGTAGLVGAAVGLVVALALSPLTPVGVARTAEPHPGVAVDAVALGLGALASLVLVLVAGAWPAWRAATVTAAGGYRAALARPSVVAAAVARTAAPVPVTTGVRLALEPGRGRSAVPLRSTLTGAVIGIVALAGALGFGASLQHLLATPRLYGATWDARVTSLSQDPVSTVLPAVEGDGAVADISTGYSGVPMALGPVRVDAIAVAPVRGSTLMPTALEGRLPAAPDEIVLGTRTMAQVHTHIGGTVDAIVADASTEPLPLKVVGRAVFPSLSDALGLGRGAGLTPEALPRLVPTAGALPAPDTILIRFRRGVDPARARSDLQRRMAALGPFAALRPERPVDLVNFGQVQNLPVLLGALLGAFAAATLAHLLATSIRRRRRDLAVLKTLGLAPRQVRATVAWQSTTLAVVALMVGIPLGVAAGRSVWLLFAHQLGILPEPAVPVIALVVLAVATFVTANLVALLPARAAARTQPALVLRTE